MGILPTPTASSASTIRPRSKSQQVVNGHDVQLWERGRFIVRFSYEDQQLSPEAGRGSRLRAAFERLDYLHHVAHFAARFWSVVICASYS
jgi:hypothetical protein